jgi:hypothetical protein
LRARIAQQQFIGYFHITGPGRQPRNPIGVLKAFIIMRMKGIRSLRELVHAGLGGVSVYALLSVLCIVLNREAAERMGRPDKALSLTFFNV